MRDVRIYLTNRKDAFTLISAIDFEWISKLRWYQNKGGYVVGYFRSPDGRKLSSKTLHRLITKAPPGLEVDHINRNRMDNRRENLRLVTRWVNSLNVSPRSLAPDDVGLRARYFRKGVRWQAYINWKNSQIVVGSFESKNDAREARLTKLSQLLAEVDNGEN